MSRILINFNKIKRTRFFRPNFIATRNFVQQPTKVFFVKLTEPAFLAVQPEFKYLNQIEGYSKKFLDGSKDDRVAKALSKLSSNVVSLPFTQFDHVRPSLLRNFSISVEDGFAILKSCSRLVDRSVDDRIRLVDETWNNLLTLIGQPHKNQVIFLLQAYQRSGRKSLEDYASILEQLKCPADKEIFEELIYLACQNDDSMENALKLVDDMKAAGFEPTERVYAALVLGHSKAGAFEGVLTEMKAKKIDQTEITFTELAKAHLRNGSSEKAIETLKRSDRFTTDQLYEVIRSAIHVENEECIIHALNLLPESIQNAKLIAPELQNICIEALYSNKDPYHLVIRHLPAPIFENENSCEYGTFLLKEMISKNENLTKILKFCQDLTASERNMRPIHYCCVSALAHKCSMSRDFLNALAEKEPLRPHYFWPLFAQSANDEDILKVLQLAKELNVSFDIETYLYYVLPRMATLLDPQQILKVLSDQGARMNVLKTAFVAFLVSQNRLESALDIADRSKSGVNPFILQASFVKYIRSKHFSTKNSHLIAIILKKLQLKVTEADYDLAGQIVRNISVFDEIDGFEVTKKLIKSFDQVGVKISRNSADMILQKMKKLRNVFDYTKPILEKIVSDEMFPEVHEKQRAQQVDTQVEALEKQLIELKASGFPPLGVLYKLFSKYVQLKRYDDAVRILKVCEAEGVIKTPPMLSQLLNLWTSLKKTDDALEVYRELKENHSKFKLDTFKAIDLATLLIEKDRLQEATDVLKSIKQTNPKNIEYIVNNVYRLLDASRQYAQRNGTSDIITQAVMNILLAKNLCKASNVNLGFVIKEYIEKKDLKSALLAFEQYATEFNETPQMMTVIIELIKILNQTDDTNDYQVSKEQAVEHLQRIIELSTKVHGAEKANVNVILSFASTGNRTQLRRIMMDPQMKFDIKHLADSLEYFKNHKKVDVIIAIARSARGLSHTSLHEENLYGLILSHFIRENDHESAMQFYDELLKHCDGEMPTPTAKTLVAFLKRNNRQIPEKLQTFAY